MIFVIKVRFFIVVHTTFMRKIHDYFYGPVMVWKGSICECPIVQPHCFSKCHACCRVVHLNGVKTGFVKPQFHRQLDWPWFLGKQLSRFEHVKHCFAEIRNNTDFYVIHHLFDQRNDGPSLLLRKQFSKKYKFGCAATIV